MKKEIDYFGKALEQPERPLLGNKFLNNLSFLSSLTSYFGRSQGQGQD